MLDLDWLGVMVWKLFKDPKLQVTDAESYTNIVFKYVYEYIAAHAWKLHYLKNDEGRLLWWLWCPDGRSNFDLNLSYCSYVRSWKHWSALYEISFVVNHLQLGSPNRWWMIKVVTFLCRATGTLTQINYCLYFHVG